MTETQRLTREEQEFADWLGESVALNHNIIVAGMINDESPTGAGAGAVYVYEKPENGWIDMIETAKLTASDRAMNDAFGSSVAISDDGTVIAVGAPGENGLKGATYVFEKFANRWVNATEMAKLTVFEHLNQNREIAFGGSVSLEENILVVGAYGSDNMGAAYIFERPNNGWVSSNTFNAKLTSKDKDIGDKFGTQVAIDGYIIAATDPKKETTYIYERPANGWQNSTETTKFINSNKGSLALDGISIITANDTESKFYRLNIHPEFNLTGKGSNINNNQTPELQNDTDFGQAIIGETITKTFTIHNSNCGILELVTPSSSPSIVNIQGSSEFTVSRPVNKNELSGGETTTFDISFTPKTIGESTATVIIEYADIENGNSYFTYAIKGTGTTALSIVQVNFYGEATLTGHQLNWSVMDNDPVDSYTLQSSIDGKNWMTITNIPNVLGQSEYNYSDSEPKKNPVYYRLQINTNSGSFYSSTIVLEVYVDSVLLFYPNPAIDKIFFNIEQMGKENNTEVQIFSSNGYLVRRTYLQGQYLLIDDLAKGLYLIQVRVENRVLKGKFVVL
ncbi:MAG: choice-of-anchor D domain-containing protein [Saprospiraceae bacterium]